MTAEGDPSSFDNIAVGRPAPEIGSGGGGVEHFKKARPMPFPRSLEPTFSSRDP